MLALNAVTLAPAAAVVGATPLPPYLDPYLQHVALFANDQWKLGNTTVGAAAFTGTPALYSNYSTPGGDPLRYMWAHSCSAGPQTVEFLRKVWLPGAPDRVDFHLRPSLLTQNGHSWGQPLSLVKLVVNDTLITKTTSNDINLETSASAIRHAFKPGINRIDLLVTKHANPSYISACSGSRAPARLGIEIQLIGDGFPVDLGFRPYEQGEKVQYFHVTPGTSQAFFYTFTVHNYGPSWSRAGHFQFKLQHGFMDLSYPMASVAADPFHDCTITQGTLADCVYDDDWLPPGGTATLKFYWKLTAPTDEGNGFADQVLLDWYVAPANNQIDPQLNNDTGTKTVVFCYPGATDYGCDKN